MQLNVVAPDLSSSVDSGGSHFKSSLLQQMMAKRRQNGSQQNVDRVSPKGSLTNLDDRHLDASTERSLTPEPNMGSNDPSITDLILTHTEDDSTSNNNMDVIQLGEELVREAKEVRKDVQDLIVDTSNAMTDTVVPEKLHSPLSVKDTISEAHAVLNGQQKVSDQRCGFKLRKKNIMIQVYFFMKWRDCYSKTPSQIFPVIGD